MTKDLPGAFGREGKLPEGNICPPFSKRTYHDLPKPIIVSSTYSELKTTSLGPPEFSATDLNNSANTKLWRQINERINVNIKWRRRSQM